MAGKFKMMQINMTMNWTTTLSALVLLSFTILFTGCEDNRLNDIVDDKVYLLEHGLNEQQVFNMQDYTYHLTVMKSGVGQQSGTLKLVTDENILTTYNEENGTEYQLLPSEYYEITTQDLALGKKDYRLSFEISMNAESIKEHQAQNEEQFVIPFRAQVVSGSFKEGEPKEMESLLLPSVIDPYLALVDTGLVTGTIGIDFDSPDETLIFPEVEVNFPNRWDIDFEVEVDPSLVHEYNERNGTNYTVLNPAAFKIDEETLTLQSFDEDHAFKISVLKKGFIDGNGDFLFGDYIIPIRITSSSKFSIDPEKRVQLIPVSFRPNKLDRTEWVITDWNSCICEEPQYEGLGRIPETLLDGDADTFWGSKWDEPRPFPHYFVFDMQTSHKVYQFDLIKPLSASWRGNIKSGYFEISDDGESWTKIGSWEMVENATREHNYKVTPTTGRYIKLVIDEAFTYFDPEIGAESGANVDLAEFVVWGE